MARKHTGNIYQRKEGGAFYADYYSGGRRVREALIGDDGKPVFDKATAEALLAARMYRLNAPTASQQIEGLENERRTIEEKAALAAAEEERRRQAKEAEEERKRQAEEEHKRLISERREERERVARENWDNAWILYMSAEPQDGVRLERLKCLKGLTAGDTIPPMSQAKNVYKYFRNFAEAMKSRGIQLLSEVTGRDAQAFLDGLRKSLTAKTVNSYRSTIFSIYNYLIKTGTIQCVNPFADVPRAEAEAGEEYTREAFTLTELKTLLSMATGEVRLLVMLGYYCGLRLGDAATLKWSEVDLDERMITRVQNKVRKRVKKKESATVRVGINSDLMAELAAIPEGERGVYVLPMLAADYATMAGRKRIAREIAALMKKCGITTREIDSDGRGHCIRGFHSLRHSNITKLTEAGANATAVSKLAGHSNLNMTAHYAHLTSDTAHELAEKLVIVENPRSELSALIVKMDNAQVQRTLEFVRQLMGVR